MKVLGIIGNPGSECHNSSAALVIDSVVVAAAEQERFSRRKHALGEAPYDAVSYCLEQGGLTLDDIDCIAISWEPEDVSSTLSDEEKKILMKKLFPRCLFKYKKEILPCKYVRHHISHIASSFYQSGFKEAACLVVDGQGENESITLAKAEMGKIEIIKTFPISCSLGAFYDAATEYVGLGVNVPGKFMGLASYGQPVMEDILKFDVESGEFSCKVSSIKETDSFYDTRKKYLEYFEQYSYPYREREKSKVGTAELMPYINFAASIQSNLDHVIYSLSKYLKEKTGLGNLVLAGGVTLNCTSNGYLDRTRLYNNIFVYPAANDAGCSVGAALEIERQNGTFDVEVPKKISSAYLGKKYSDLEIESSVINCKYPKKHFRDNNLLAMEIAKLLADNKIIAWLQSGFEFGPRALGARSILANPGKRENVDRVNIVKDRELWRPLSPIVLDRFYKEIFIDDTPENMSEFMLKTCEIRDNWIPKIPAVVHVDKTSRPQYLSSQVNPKLYLVLDEFQRITGIPLLINTSFNIRKQPIINSPREAIIEFESNTNLDGIVLGNWFIYR